MNQQDASRIKQLGLDALKNANPNLRKMALLELRNYDTPIVSEVFERVIQKDRDKEVRNLAQNLLTKIQIQAAQRPPKLSGTAPAQAGDRSINHTWKCSFCGSEISDAERCPNCGAERKHTANSVAAKMKIDADTFLLYPSHRDYVLGKSKSLNRNSIFSVGCMTLFASIFVFFGAVFLVGMVWDTYQWFMINQQGVTVSAQVTRLRMSSSDDIASYLISFQYSHNGSQYTREQSVAQAVYNSAEVGGNIQVIYVPSTPQLAKVAGTNSAPIALLLFALVWNGIVALVIFFAVRQYRRMKFLERNGKMLPGEILESTHSTDSDGDLSLRVEYTFIAPDSKKRVTHTERAQRNDLKGKRPPAPGTPIIILYYNEQQYILL